MLYAVCRDGTRTYAPDTLKGQGPFSCWHCHWPMFLHIGSGRMTPHFNHAPGSDCPYSESMSEEHYQAQRYISEFFGGEMEKPIGERIADVFVERPSGKPWMFEIQGVNLVTDEQIARTVNHCSYESGAMTWLILKDISDVKLADEYSVPMYEKWAYGANSETNKFNDGHVWWIDGKQRKLYRVEYKNAIRYITDHSTGRYDHPVPKIDHRNLVIFGPYGLEDIKFTTRLVEAKQLRYGTHDPRHSVSYPKFKRLIMSEKCEPVQFFG